MYIPPIKYFSLFVIHSFFKHICLSLHSFYIFYTAQNLFKLSLFKKKLDFSFLSTTYNRWMSFSSFVFFVNCFSTYTFYKNKNSMWNYRSTMLNNSFHNTSVYLNHHSCSFFTSISSLVLPTTLFIEKSSKYTSIEGSIHQTRRILRKFNSIKYDWIIWQDLFMLASRLNNFSLNILFSLHILCSILDSSFKYFFYYYYSSINYTFTYSFITSCLVFEFPYFNFLNFTQNFFFFFLFFYDFFLFSFLCSGEYFKFSFFMHNSTHINSTFLFTSYKKYVFSQYSTLLYNHTYTYFY